MAVLTKEPAFPASRQRTCAGCQRELPEAAFQDPQDPRGLCPSCESQRASEVERCAGCGKLAKREDLAAEETDAQRLLCAICQPEGAMLHCTVCDEDKARRDFQAGMRRQCLTIRRCNACAVACSTCGRRCADSRSFATNSSQCWACQRASREHTCDVCKKTKATEAFDEHILRNAQGHQRPLVCRECEAQGYSPQDTSSYQCSGGHVCGHLSFGAKLLDNVKCGHTSRLTCMACLKEQQPRGKKRLAASGVFACDACHKSLPEEAFGAEMLNNARGLVAAERRSLTP